MSSKTSSRSTFTMVPSTMSPSLKYLMVSSIAARKASSDPMSSTATWGVEVASVLLVMCGWTPDTDRYRKDGHAVGPSSSIGHPVRSRATYGTSRPWPPAAGSRSGDRTVQPFHLLDGDSRRTHEPTTLRPEYETCASWSIGTRGGQPDKSHGRRKLPEFSSEDQPDRDGRPALLDQEHRDDGHSGSLRLGSRTGPLQGTPPLLGVQTSLPRRTTGLGGSASARWWGRRLGQNPAHPFHRPDPVAGLGTMLLHTHREHTVHQTPGQAFQGTLTPGPTQAPAGSHVDRQRHPGRRRLDVLPTRAGGAGKTPPEIIGGDGHRAEVDIAHGFARIHCPHLPVGLHSLCAATRTSVRGVVPVLSTTDGHRQRHPQIMGRGHLPHHELLEGLALTGGDLHHQLVVHLQQDPRGIPTLAQGGVHP